MKERKPIAQANLGRILIDRVAKTDMNTGAITYAMRLELHGAFADDEGNSIKADDGNPMKEYKWDAVPDMWKNPLETIFKAMSREFNKEFADEDTETFEITEEIEEISDAPSS